MKLLSCLLFLTSTNFVLGGLVDRIRQCNKYKDTCSFCQELTENNLSTAHAWFFREGHREEKKLPVPNLHLAMAGYDIFAGDHFAERDPGTRSQIFEPLREENGRTHVNSFIEGIDSEIDCDGDFTVVPIKNMNEYSSKKIHGYRLYLGNFSQDHNLLTEPGLPFGFSPKSNPSAFVGKAHCVTASVELSPFEVPVFTSQFESALRILNDAAKRPSSLRSRDTAFTFFKTYGTHYMKSTILGSKIIFGKEFTSKALSADENKKRVSCLTEKSKKSLQEGKGKMEVLSEKFLSNLAGCDSSNSLSKSPDEDQRMTLALGPLPKQTLNTWSTDAIENPVPIDFELMKISHLFQQSWLDSITRKGEEQMNGELMYKFFQSMMVDYCRAVWGKSCGLEAHANSIGNYAYNDETGVETSKAPDTKPKWSENW